MSNTENSKCQKCATAQRKIVEIESVLSNRDDYIEALETKIQELTEYVEEKPLPLTAFVGKQVFFKGLFLGTISEAEHYLERSGIKERHIFIVELKNGDKTVKHRFGDLRTSENFSIREISA